MVMYTQNMTKPTDWQTNHTQRTNLKKFSGTWFW